MCSYAGFFLPSFFYALLALFSSNTPPLLRRDCRILAIAYRVARLPCYTESEPLLFESTDLESSFSEIMQDVVECGGLLAFRAWIKNLVP